jgi:DNA-binding CsgD family transcriptional regulator
MKQELIEQRKMALQYNEAVHDSWSSAYSPLQHLGVDWFVYSLFSLDQNSQTVGYQALCSNTEYLRIAMFQFEDNGKSFTEAIRQSPHNQYSYFLWPNAVQCPLIQTICDNFMVPKGITVYLRKDNFVQGWSFGSTGTSAVPRVITDQTVAPFLAFIRKFNTTQENNKLMKTIPFVNYPVQFDMSYSLYSPDLIRNFNNSISEEKSALHLSEREWQCLRGMSQGKPMKLIAYELGIGQRTVETHLNNIRKKTGTSSKLGLIDLFWRSRNKGEFLPWTQNF